VLLIGGAGTLGSDILAANLPDFEFFVLDDFQESTLTEIEVSKLCGYKNSNVANQKSIQEVFLMFKPNVVIYLATTLSTNQHRALESNVLGLSNIIKEASIDCRPYLIYIQSFLTRESLNPITEKTPLVSHDSYSTWKLAGELLLSSYLGKKTTIILSSVISPLISVGAIPAFIKKISSNEQIKITNTSRDYIDTVSFIKSLEILITHDFKIEQVVIGSGRDTSTEEVFKIVSKCLGLKVDNLKFEVTEPKSTDPIKIVLDSSLFQSTTKWKSEFDLESQISKVVKTFLARETSVRLHH
jgi:nucleoside-diphosphate-sugar epimerase